ncbi:hypothetical protein FWD20_00910 [Candidatus Saccharibacteria bacterium]|nr:hypothetical protein [Candidatus Saccharibacteria bacterium]
MSESAVIDYLKNAPLAKLAKVARIVDQRLAKSKTDAAIAEGRQDIKNNKIHTEAEVDRLLADKFGI